MKNLLLLCVLLLSFSAFQAQIVETVIAHPKIVDDLYGDADGNIYTTSGGLTGGGQLGKYDPNTDQFDPNFALGFAGPISIKPYRDSLFIVTNYDNNTASQLNLNTGIVTTIATGLDGPSGLVVDSLDNIYIVNWGGAPAYNGHEIHKIDPQGNVSVYIDSSALTRLQAIAINHLGEIVVHSDKKMFKINQADSSLQYWTSIPMGVANMVFRQQDSCFYGAGGHRVTRIDRFGVASTLAGVAVGYVDGHVSVARFNAPLGVAFSPTEDTLYVSEGGNSRRLRRILMDESLTWIPEPATYDELLYPNPSGGQVTLEFPFEGKANVLVYGLNSAITQQLGDVQSGDQIDLSELPAGMYWVVVSQQEKTITLKLQLQK